MKIHALSTGTVRCKQSFLFARSGPMRQLSIFMPGEFSDPLPIHIWVIEHEGQRILVDTGETREVNDVPFAKFAVAPDEELPNALGSIGLTIDDIDTVVLTHMHGDHMDGATHLGDKPVMVHDAEVAHANSGMSKFFAKVLKQPIPAGINWQQFTLDGGPFGAFATSRKLTDDGRVRIVATPGHTPGHVSVICIDDDDRHVFIAGDATDSLEQLRSRRHDAVGPKPKVTVETIDRILAHGREHPTVFLPSHDPESASRLAAGTTL
jgi:glyoxylase-like metal-dependent hydrolase (beta-lactamase superfamily II)